MLTDEEYLHWVEREMPSDLEALWSIICLELKIECCTCAIQDCEGSTELATALLENVPLT